MPAIPTYKEFVAFWRLSEEMIANATKEELAETCRSLAMQAVQMTRKYGEQQLPDLVGLLSASTLNDESVALLRNGVVAFVGAQVRY